MATIRQIARDLKVSTSTVSAVINKNGYVSDSLRARIEKALHEADYRPNQIARSLRLRETRTIALIVPDLANTFYAHLMRGAEDYLSSTGYRLIVADTREDWKRQYDYLMLFSGNTTDGIILVPSMATDDQIASIRGWCAQRRWFTLTAARCTRKWIRCWWTTSRRRLVPPNICSNSATGALVLFPSRLIFSMPPSAFRVTNRRCALMAFVWIPSSSGPATIRKTPATGAPWSSSSLPTARPPCSCATIA